jgi:predicted ribosome quality control (RQC) complex YloA/Tae2 family protein
MDNLVLTRLAVEWSSTLVGHRLDSIRQESGERFRLAFTSEKRDLVLVVSLDPRTPWMGEAIRRWEGPRWSPDRFVGVVAHALQGRIVTGLRKDPADRTIILDFGEGHGLVVELAPHHANLVLLGAQGTVAASLRSPKSAHEQLTPGRPFVSRGLPAGRLDPFFSEPEAIDAAVAAGVAAGLSPAASLQRCCAGVSTTGAELAVSEQADTGRSLGAILRARCDSIRLGSAEVLIEESGRLLPWRSVGAVPAPQPISRGGPAATAAHFYETRDAKERVHARIAGLGRILRGELDRTRSAEGKVREGIKSFADPERYRRMAEALLASLTFARRSGDVVIVPDPYDPDGREISIPAPPNRSLAQIADDLFSRQRRAKRGLESAGARAETLSGRASRLAGLLVVHGETTDETGTASLEAEMRREGLAVGLAGPTRAARAASLVAPPKLEGVRMLESSDGWTILVGRTGRDNDRLTFKLAAPDDIWLHAAGVHGAHVIIRNPERAATVPPATLAEAARFALWFSDARSEAGADVNWTRRKNVRRAKGGAPGRVVLKRFFTVRVRAQAPPESP